LVLPSGARLHVFSAPKVGDEVRPAFTSQNRRAEWRSLRPIRSQDFSEQEARVTQPNKHNSSPGVSLDGPICPHCHVHTALSVIEPDQPGHALHTFRCALCGYEESVVTTSGDGNLMIHLKSPR
jgi:hypothetical protein